MKIKSLGMAAIAGLAALGGGFPSWAQPVAPTAPWYNCSTREVWLPAKRAWCEKVEVLKNATYVIPQNPSYITPALVTVKLTQGKYEDAAQHLSVILASQPGTLLFGDLNGDGAEDAVSLLAVNTGGSGVFTYLVAVLDRDGTLQPALPILLGDRIQVKSMAIGSGKISVTMVTQGPNDPMCCPTLTMTEDFGLQYQLVPLP